MRKITRYKINTTYSNINCRTFEHQIATNTLFLLCYLVSTDKKQFYLRRILNVIVRK